MIGNEHLGRQIVRHLQENLDQAARMVEQAHGHPEGTCLVPRRENIHPAFVDVIALGDFPAIMVLQDDTEPRQTARFEGVGALAEELQMTYRFQIVQHSQHTDYGVTERRRKLLLDAVRQCFMQTRLIWESEDREENAIFHPSGFREVFNGSMDNDEKILLESSTYLTIHTNERVHLPGSNLGPVGRIDHAAGMANHPANQQ